MRFPTSAEGNPTFISGVTGDKMFPPNQIVAPFPLKDAIAFYNNMYKTTPTRTQMTTVDGSDGSLSAPPDSEGDSGGDSEDNSEDDSEQGDQTIISTIENDDDVDMN